MCLPRFVWEFSLTTADFCDVCVAGRYCCELYDDFAHERERDLIQDRSLQDPLHSWVPLRRGQPMNSKCTLRESVKQRKLLCFFLQKTCHVCKCSLREVRESPPRRCRAERAPTSDLYFLHRLSFTLSVFALLFCLAVSRSWHRPFTLGDRRNKENKYYPLKKINKYQTN